MVHKYFCKGMNYFWSNGKWKSSKTVIDPKRFISFFPDINCTVEEQIEKKVESEVC